jgi:hypothetical protein
MIHVPSSGFVTLRVDGPEVLLIVNGVLISRMPWQAALELSKGLHAQGKIAEQYSKIDQVISDQALAIRAGIPLALTTRPDALAEAWKEAAWNSDLRRTVPDNHTDKVYSPELSHESKIDLLRR